MLVFWVLVSFSFSSFGECVCTLLNYQLVGRRLRLQIKGPFLCDRTECKANGFSTLPLRQWRLLNTSPKVFLSGLSWSGNKNPKILLAHWASDGQNPQTQQRNPPPPGYWKGLCLDTAESVEIDLRSFGNEKSCEVGVRKIFCLLHAGFAKPMSNCPGEVEN